MNFVLWLVAKVFSTKFGGMAFVGSKREQPAKVFLQELFSLLKVSCYMVYLHIILLLTIINN